MFEIVKPGFPRIFHTFAYTVHQSGLVLWFFPGKSVMDVEPHLRFMSEIVEPAFPRIVHTSVYRVHQGGLVLW